MKRFLAPLKKYLPSRQSKIVKKALTNPRRDWTLVLLSTLLLGVCAAVFSYYSFVTYFAIDQQTVVVSVKTLHYQGPQIREQVAHFNDMKARYAALTASGAAPTLPSASSTPAVATSTPATEGAALDEVPQAAL